MPNITDERFKWTGSLNTDISKRFRAEGWKPKEEREAEAEMDQRREGALRCMKKLQAPEIPTPQMNYLRRIK